MIGIDFSDSMLDRARKAKAEMGLNNVEFRKGEAERLPIEDDSIDVVLVNGIFNLNPERQAIFEEVARVLRPGASVYVAEIILREPLPPDVIQSEADWFA